MMVERILQKVIERYLFRNKAIIILGPRQVGKTTLLHMLSEKIDQKYLYLNCDEPDIRKSLTDITSTELRKMIGTNKVVMIDEAQRVKNIGITLKLITDQIKEVQLIATGSSAFELANEINEPLTGRKFEFLLLPFSTGEMLQYHGLIDEKRLLESRMLYGMYPDVINNSGNEKVILNNLVDSYLFKDIFSFQDVRKPIVIEKLLEAIALQVCSEVSMNELAQLLQVDRSTVQRYIELLEKTFIIFRLPSLNRNIRTEIRKNQKIYFYDNGIRNSIISNFNSIELRPDKGALWENFLMSERMKLQRFHLLYRNNYFWRTLQQQEIDYIEEYDGKLYAYEFKWKSVKKVRFPKTFLNAYPKSETKVITQENYLEFIS